MPTFTVELMIFACTGDSIEVTAATEDEAERLAKRIAEERFATGIYADDRSRISPTV